MGVGGTRSPRPPTFPQPLLTRHMQYLETKTVWDLTSIAPFEVFFLIIFNLIFLGGYLLTSIIFEKKVLKLVY